MKLIWFLLISLYEFSICVLGQDFLPPENVIIKRLSQVNGESHTFATLKMLPNQVLANENLPVWIAHGQWPYTLELLPNVMNEIGPFSLYQDADKCTAAVFFHETETFTGNIANDQVMENVQYDHQTGELLINENNIRSSRRSTHDERALQEEDLSNWKYVATRLRYLRTVYIEVLVMIDYDLAVEFQHKYAALVSHVLVHFNNVDMLYSKASDPKIKINIAGIVIAEERESFPELVQQNCYQLYDGVHEGLDMTCVLREMKNTIYNFREKITPQSYDVAIFLSRNDMFGPAYNEEGEEITALFTGAAKRPDGETYNGFRSLPEHLRVAVVHVPDQPHQYFLTIAHALEHLFNVYHDNGHSRNDDGECTANAMKLDGGFCTDCIYFSDQSLQQMTRFFNSRDGCIFRNEPNSLTLPLRVQELLTDWQQCDCYGYETSNTEIKEWMQDYKVWSKAMVTCDQELQCVRYEDGQKIVENTTYFMDGTPCGYYLSGNACWNGQCLSTGH